MSEKLIVRKLPSSASCAPNVTVLDNAKLLLTLASLPGLLFSKMLCYVGLGAGDLLIGPWLACLASSSQMLLCQVGVERCNLLFASPADESEYIQQHCLAWVQTASLCLFSDSCTLRRECTALVGVCKTLLNAVLPICSVNSSNLSQLKPSCTRPSA